MPLVHLPTAGELFTLEQFKRMVEHHYVSDQDGFGKWATIHEFWDENDLVVYPSEFGTVHFEASRPRGATHVLWFNK